MDADDATLRQILALAAVDVDNLEVLFTIAVPIQGFAISSRDALPLWKRYRRLLVGSGWYPLIVGDQESLERLEEDWLEGQGNFEQIVSEGILLDPSLTLQRLGDDLWEDTPLGRWSSKMPPRAELSIPYQNWMGEPTTMTHLAFLPVEAGWQVPAALKLGGWNFCPKPSEHVAILRYWWGRWGAEPVAARFDTLEFQVTALPPGREEAFSLAKEHLSYCSDVLWEQEPATLRALASCLLHSPIWYFWWD